MTEPSGASTLASNAFEQQELFPIREVSRLTGVNPVTLRAWERRYGLIRPTRTDSGHRLYSMADVEAVRSILARLNVASRSARSAAFWPQRGYPRGGRADGHRYRRMERMAGAASRSGAQLRRGAPEQLYGQVFSTYPLAVVFQTCCYRSGRRCCCAGTNSVEAASGCSSTLSCARGAAALATGPCAGRRACPAERVAGAVP